MIGIDEVGRGAWAGPLLVVAVKLKPKLKLPIGVADSKTLSRVKREKLFKELLTVCAIGEGWVSAVNIDQLGLSAAMTCACQLALLDLGAKNDEIIYLDGKVNFLKGSSYCNVQTIIDGDNTEPIIAAASIVAKVMRDQHMQLLDQRFPDYGFASHVGYGTKKHLQALKDHGICIEHRRSYKPVAAFA